MRTRATEVIIQAVSPLLGVHWVSLPGEAGTAAVVAVAATAAVGPTQGCGLAGGGRVVEATGAVVAGGGVVAGAVVAPGGVVAAGAVAGGGVVCAYALPTGKNFTTAATSNTQARAISPTRVGI